jgi:hypothetical protein
VADRARSSASEEPEPWEADPGLTAHLGPQGAAAFAAMFDAFPEAVGLLWAARDEGGRIVDFDFGYGNPAIMRMFGLPRTQTGRYTVLEALPQMRDDGTFDRYARVCDTASRGSTRSPSTRPSATATSAGRSCAARASSATG